MNRKICITCLFLKAISISDAVCPIWGKVTAVPVLVIAAMSAYWALPKRLPRERKSKNILFFRR